MQKLVLSICFIFECLSAYTQSIHPAQQPAIQYPFDNSGNQQRYINDLPGFTNNSKTITLYPIINFSPAEKEMGTINLNQANSVKLIDARFDKRKVGFFPCDNKSRNQLSVVGLQLTGGLLDWLQKSLFEKNIVTDSTSKRQLIIILRKFWFGHSANVLYKKTDPPLITSLYYHYDVFSLIDSQYYPIKKIEGSLSAYYNNSSSYNVLSDSMLLILKNELGNLNLKKKEIESNRILPADFRVFYNQYLGDIAFIEKKPKGLYRNYQDFIENRPSADSAEFVIRYNNYERSPMYACQLVPQQTDSTLNSKKSWGYFDGESLFVNAGAGVYLKLIRNNRDFIFLYLKNIGEDKITKDMFTNIIIGNSSYSLLNTYTKKFAITYQLDYETGKLY